MFFMDNTGNSSQLIQQAALKQDEILSHKFKTDEVMRVHYENETTFIESNRINFINMSTMSEPLLHQTQQLRSRGKNRQRL